MRGRDVVAEMEREGERYLVIGYSPSRPPCLVQLTPSEVDVIDRWIGGEPMRCIAKARRAAERTVANQIASAYRKLGVGSRQELLNLLHGESRETGK